MAVSAGIEIRKNIETGKLIIGTEKTLKMLKLGKIKKVYFTTNCQDDVKKNIDYYAKLGKADVVKLKYSNEELGVICKKPFAISVVSLLKDAI